MNQRASENEIILEQSVVDAFNDFDDGDRMAVCNDVTRHFNHTADSSDKPVHLYKNVPCVFCLLEAQDKEIKKLTNKLYDFERITNPSHNKLSEL